MKKLGVVVLFERQAYSETDLLLITGYFKKTCTIEVTEQPSNKYAYLYFDQKNMSNVCFRTFGVVDYTFPISLYVPKNEERFTVTYSDAVRITDKEARQMLINKEAIALFDSEELNSHCIQKTVFK